MSGGEGPVSAQQEADGDRRHEKLDRELMELLDELRVALPGVQVLFAFLLTVAFSQGFAKMTVTQRNGYFATLLTTAATTAFLMAPTAFHRLRWRRSDKERLLTFGNRMAIIGIAFLAVSVCGAVFLISDVCSMRGSPYRSRRPQEPCSPVCGSSFPSDERRGRTLTCARETQPSRDPGSVARNRNARSPARLGAGVSSGACVTAPGSASPC
jgi:hypothetical protein